jgi:predicted DNA-binding transcriptional regulator YafY
MPVNKNALARYVIIDKCIRDTRNRYPSREYLRKIVSEKLNTKISDSTIDKDIKALKEEQNAPILFDRNRNGYYYSDSNYSFKNSINDEDLWIMEFATAAMRVLGDESMNKKFKGISNRMSKGSSTEEDAEPEFFNFISIEGSYTKSGYHWLFDLYMHIINSRTVSIAYAPFGREKKTHIVSPYLLKQNKNRWYLIGHSHSTSSTIVLALDRIERIELSREKYYHDKKFDKDAYLRHSYGVFHTNEFPPEKVRLQFSNTLKPYILSEPIHKTQVVITDDAAGLTIELDIYCKGNIDFIGKVLSYGDDVLVLSPGYLKDEVINRANGMIEKYL